MKVKPNEENTIVTRRKGHTGRFSIGITVDGNMTRRSVTGNGIPKIPESFMLGKDALTVTVKIERNSDSLPFVCSLMIK